MRIQRQNPLPKAGKDDILVKEFLVHFKEMIGAF
jgi:hypothetical protein